MTHLTMCASALTQPLTLSKEFRILPAGRFKAIDGRPGEDQYWNLSEATGLRLVAEAANRNQDYLIDYEHQSLSGQQSPAAGWFNTLVWKTDGLYVQAAKWTAAAKAMIVKNEYRFISPVFTYSHDTKEVATLLSIALTNNPALPRLTDLSNVALTQQHNPKGVVDNQSMDKISSLLRLPVADLIATKESDEKERQRANAPMSGRSLEIFSHCFPELKPKS